MNMFCRVVFALISILVAQHVFAAQNQGTYTAVTNNRWIVTNSTVANANLFYVGLQNGPNVMKLDLAFDVAHTNDFTYSGSMGRTDYGGNGQGYQWFVGTGNYFGNFASYFFVMTDSVKDTWVCSMNQSVNGTCTVYTVLAQNLGTVTMTWIP